MASPVRLALPGGICSSIFVCMTGPRVVEGGRVVVMGCGCVYRDDVKAERSKVTYGPRGQNRAARRGIGHRK